MNLADLKDKDFSGCNITIKGMYIGKELPIITIIIRSSIESIKRSLSLQKRSKNPIVMIKSEIKGL